MSINKHSKPGIDYGYHEPLPGLVMKIQPQELIDFQHLIMLPDNIDLFKAASSGNTFESCIGEVAAVLGILIDGEYDVPELLSVLNKAIETRRKTIITPADYDPRLVRETLKIINPQTGMTEQEIIVNMFRSGLR